MLYVLEVSVCQRIFVKSEFNFSFSDHLRSSRHLPEICTPRQKTVIFKKLFLYWVSVIFNVSSIYELTEESEALPCL